MTSMPIPTVVRFIAILRNGSIREFARGFVQDARSRGLAERLAPRGWPLELGWPLVPLGNVAFLLVLPGLAENAVPSLVVSRQHTFRVRYAAPRVHSMTRGRFWDLLSFLALLIAFALAGCGGRAGRADASSAGAAYGGAPMAPPTPMDAVEVSAEGDAQADEAAPAPEPAMQSAPASKAASADKAGAPPPVQAPMPVAKPAPEKMRGESGARDRESKPAEAPGTTSGGQKVVASQMLVYTANLHIRVQEVAKAIDAVEKLAKERGGYLVLREDNRITIRIPSAKFDPALDELARLGDLVHRNVSIEDVTDLYFDMQIRMKNLEVVRNRLEELLKKATTVEESLAVQRQLERVTGELERMRGKLKLLAELVMFSTITVVFEPKSTEHIDSKVRLPFPWMDRLGLGELLRL